jgi:hypothetical protein
MPARPEGESFPAMGLGLQPFAMRDALACVDEERAE